MAKDLIELERSKLLLDKSWRSVTPEPSSSFAFSQS